MDWANERYVRLYTRDSVSWTVMSWEARALLCLVLRKLDRAGVLELGRHGARGLAAIVGMPPDVTAAALDELLAEGTFELNGETLVMPNFLTAQEARISDAQRARDHREKRLSSSRQNRKDDNTGVTLCHTESRPVTAGHTPSHSVTPSLATPSLAELSPAENNHAEAEIPPARYGRAAGPDHEPAAPAVARGHDLGSRRDRALEQLRASYEAAGKSLAGDGWRTGDMLARRREIADALKNTLGHTPETPVPLEALELAISCSAALASQQNRQRPGAGTRAFRSLWRSEKALRLAMGFSSVADAVSGAGPPQSAKRDIRVGRVEPASREEFEKLNDVEDF